MTRTTIPWLFLLLLFALGCWCFWHCARLYGKPTTRPTYIDAVRVEFSDGSNWESGKPAWCVYSHASDGRGETRWCKGAAPATTQP